MKTTFTPYALAVGLLALGATAPALAQTKVKTKSSAGKQKAVVASPTNGTGISRANLDTSVQPCDNFYQYANGGWLRAASRCPTRKPTCAGTS